MNDYDALQNKQTNPLAAELKFMIETQKPNMTAEISEMFIRQETVYGGLPGLKLYIKAQVINLYICLKIVEHILKTLIQPICMFQKEIKAYP